MTRKRAQAETIGTRQQTYATIQNGETDRPDAAAWFMAAWPSGSASPFSRQMPLSSTIQAPMMAAYGEMVSFYQLRLRRDFETLAAMTLCRTPQEVAAVCVKAATDATSDYYGLMTKPVRPKP
ncbi:MAG: hypothetical protein AAF253_14905 [Pseudomonadota bacterium]